MYVKGVSADDIRTVVDDVSARLFDGNVTIKDSRDQSNSRGARASFTLKVSNSHGPGARTSWTGRHMPVACWHAHWHVLDALLAKYPHAEVRTAMAVYTHDTFRERAADTAHRNIGSLFAPTTMPELCECGDTWTLIRSAGTAPGSDTNKVDHPYR